MVWKNALFRQVISPLVSDCHSFIFWLIGCSVFIQLQFERETKLGLQNSAQLFSAVYQGTWNCMLHCNDSWGQVINYIFYCWYTEHKQNSSQLCWCCGVAFTTPSWFIWRYNLLHRLELCVVQSPSEGSGILKLWLYALFKKQWRHANNQNNCKGT
jgi:hypothetical protein